MLSILTLEKGKVWELTGNVVVYKTIIIETKIRIKIEPPPAAKITAPQKPLRSQIKIKTKLKLKTSSFQRDNLPLPETN